MTEHTIKDLKSFLENGKILEWKHNERYYRINQDTKVLEYSDYCLSNWKKSVNTVDELINKSNGWHVVEGGK
jgi:hypothetical protein